MNNKEGGERRGCISEPFVNKRQKRGREGISHVKKISFAMLL